MRNDMRNDPNAIYRYILGQPFDMLGHHNYHPTSAVSMPVGREEVVSHHTTSHEEVEVEVDVCTDFYATQSPHQVEEISPKKPVKKKNSRQYRCKVCFKTFNQLVNLVTHERIHTGERPFRCEICLKTFTQQPNLWKHIRTHTGERPYRCETCNKGFTQQANLVKHIRIHTGEKPYVCRVCNKAFTQQANLNKHIRLHTGERPFHCRLCAKTFTQQSNLERHERTHSGAKPFSCKVCWKSFAQNVNLLKHEATHGHMKQLLNGELNKDANDFLLVQQDPLALPTMQVQANMAEVKAPEEFPSASFSCEQSCPKDHEQHERKCGIPVILCTKTGKILRRVETP